VRFPQLPPLHGVQRDAEISRKLLLRPSFTDSTVLQLLCKPLHIEYSIAHVVAFVKSQESFSADRPIEIYEGSQEAMRATWKRPKDSTLGWIVGSHSFILFGKDPLQRHR